MNKEDLYDYALCFETSRGTQGKKLLDEAFKHFSLRTCENCKYYEYLSKENGKGNRNMPYYICSNENVIMPDADGGWLEPCKDFGCNQWEQKK